MTSTQGARSIKNDEIVEKAARIISAHRDLYSDIGVGPLPVTDYDRSTARALLPLIAALQEECLDAYREALTPSADTKAAYIGEFSFNVPQILENEEERGVSVYVPWTTTKEIMAAILKRATTPPNKAQEGGEL